MMAVPVVAVTPVPSIAIAPPMGITLRQVQLETRDDGRSRRTFRLERSLRFSAEPTGFRVAVDTVSADAEADPLERDRYRAANAGLIGHPIVMHLDRAGGLLSIDDFEAVWAAWASALAAAQPTDGKARVQDVIRRLAALDPTQRAAVIGSILTASIAAPEERSPAPARIVTLASPPPFTQVELNGTTIATVAEGKVITRTTATGSTPSRDARIGLTMVRTVDAATGLLNETIRRNTISTNASTVTIESVQTLSW